MAGFLYRDPATSTHPIGSLLNALGALGAGGQDVDLASSMDEQRLFVLAHELAHQWSPSLVGTNALLSPVVDEPLAQYLAGRAMQEMMGEKDGAESRDQNVLLNYAIYRLLGGEDKAADRPTEEYSGALEYAALVYGKAPYFYVDMEKRLGKQRLDRALRGAFSDLAWEIAYGPSWLAALEANGATGAVSYGERWFSQARGDLDLELDAEGHRAMELVLGEEAGRMTTEMLSSLGMSPAELFALLGALGR